MVSASANPAEVAGASSVLSSSTIEDGAASKASAAEVDLRDEATSSAGTPPSTATAAASTAAPAAALAPQLAAAAQVAAVAAMASNIVKGPSTLGAAPTTPTLPPAQPINREYLAWSMNDKLTSL